MSRQKFQSLSALFFLVATSCPDVKTQPGDQTIGQFTFEARLTASDCQLADVPAIDAGTQFSALVTKESDSTQAYFIYQGFARDAGFDGQFLTSFHSAPRIFAECNCSATRVDESISLALFSNAQAALVDGGGCPASVDDGGIPNVPEEERPRAVEGGFDAVIACGSMSEKIVPEADAGCTCSACSMNFTLQGVRN